MQTSTAARPSVDRAATWSGTFEPPAMPSFRPYGLAGGRWEGVVTALLTLALVVIFVADIAVPAPIEVTALVLIAIVAASWLLSTAPAVAVAVCALALLAVEAAMQRISAPAAAVEAAVLCSAAIASRFYANRLKTILEGTDADEASVASTVFGLENLAHLIDASGDGVAAVEADGRVRYANAAAIAMLELPRASERQPRLDDCIAQHERARVMAQLASPTGEAPTTLAMRVRTSSGGWRDLECMHTQLRMRGRPLNCLVMWDTTEIKRLHMSASALAETAAGLAVTQPLDEALAAIARRVIEVADAAACAVFLVDGSDSVRLAGSWGLPPGYEAAANQAIKAGADPPVFQAIRTRKPVLVEDLPHQIRTQERLRPMRELVRDVTWRQAIAFPMVHAGRAIGGLSVYLRPEQHVDAPTMEFLATIASQAATAAHLSRLVAAAQDQVAAQERYRLSRELHDSLTQELYGIALGARSAKARLDSAASPLAEPLEYILELAEAGLADMRRLVLEMRPEALAKEGLVAALGQLAAGTARRHEVEVIGDLPAEPDAPLEVKLVAYRIVQEALHNVVKHAHAKHAWVRVAANGTDLAVEVDDDGTGFDPAGSFSGHFGLASMRERAESVGGTIAYEQLTGGGTSVRVRLPVAARAAVAAGGRP